MKLHRIAAAVLPVLWFAASAAAAPTPEQVEFGNRHANDAMAALAEGRVEEALALAEKALSANPETLTPAKAKLAEKLVEAGDACMKEEKPDAAARFFAPAVRLNPFSSAGPFHLARAEFAIAIRDRNLDRVEVARKLLELANRRDPNDGRVYMLWGFIALALGDYGQAANGFEGAVQRGHEVPQARKLFAEALFQHAVNAAEDGGAANAVLPWFKRCVDLFETLKDDPKLEAEERTKYREMWIQSLVNCAAMHQRAQELPAAEQMLLRLLTIEPTNHAHWYNLGLFYGDSMKYDKAVEHYEKALELAPDPAWLEPYPKLGYIHSQRGEREKAEKYLTAYLVANPDSWEANVQMASHWYRVNEVEKSIPYFERCIELEPTLTNPMRDLSQALRKTGRIADADQWLALYTTLQSLRSD